MKTSNIIIILLEKINVRNAKLASLEPLRQSNDQLKLTATTVTPTTTTTTPTIAITLTNNPKKTQHQDKRHYYRCFGSFLTVLNSPSVLFRQQSF